MTVLVSWGSTGGSTAEIGEWIADELRAAGLSVQAAPAGEIQDVSGYQAVVLGGATYAAGWHLDARQFAQRFGAPLSDRPVWVFSSGPLDTSAEQGEVPPGPQAQAAMQALHARGHITFGGRLSDEAHGWLGVVSRRMAQDGHGVDFRNPQRVRAWAAQIAAELTAAVR